MANLAMGLASQTNARSVAKISLSPCYHYQYSSTNKAIDAVFSEAEELKQAQPDVAAARLDAEKKFVHQGRAAAEALREVLVVEHRQQPLVPSAFPNAASKEVRVQTEQPGKRQQTGRGWL